MIELLRAYILAALYLVGWVTVTLIEVLAR